MKMRVYGFSWDPARLPTQVPATSVFERIEAVSGKMFGDYMAAVTRVGDWWAGVLLKIRDAKAFTKLKDEKGVLVMSAETLADDEKLAEANFFIGHSSNGHGLYSHHYMSASLMGDFGYFCIQRFQEVRKAAKEKAISAPGLSKYKQSKISKGFSGRLMIEQILKPGSFDDHVRALKDINRVEANLVSFEMKESAFRPLTTNARRKKIVLGYDANAPTGLIANALAEARKEGLVEKATVFGHDKAGSEQIYKTAHDNQVFGEYDYDTVVKSLSVRFDDLAASIKNSAVTKMLIDLGEQPKVKKVLGIP